jgi:predicted RND superfamily exporter protein
MLSQFFKRSSRWLLAAFAAVLPVVLWGAWHAYDRRDNSVLGWLPEHSPVTRAYRHFLEVFGPDETVLLSWEGCHLDDPRLAELAKAVDVQRALEPAWFADVTTGARLRDEVIDSSGLDARAATNRLRGTLIGPDGNTTCAMVTLLPLDDTGRGAAIDWLTEAAVASGVPPDAIRMTGDAVVSVAIDRENERTASTWSNISMLVALVLACGSLRSVRLGLMVIAVAGFSSLAVEAAIYFSGASMNMLVSLVPVVTFVLTISATVHLLGYWVEAFPAHGPTDAPGIAVAHGWLPSSIAGLTTVFGMASVCVSEVRPVWQFGFYGAIGTLIAFTAVFAGLPALLQVFPPPPTWKITDASWPGVRGFVRWLVNWRRMTAAMSLSTMLLLGLGLFWLKTEVRPVRFLPQASKWITDLEWFNEHIGPFQTVDVVLAFDALPESARGHGLGDRAALVQDVESRLRETLEVRGSTSAATFLPDAVLGAAGRGQVRSVIRRGVIDGMLRRHRAGLVEAGMVATDGDREWWRISLQVENFRAAEEKRLRSAIEPLVRDAAGWLEVDMPRAIVFTGGVPLVISAQAELLDSLVESSVTAFLTIGAVLAVFFRNPFIGLLAMVPNLFPLAIVFGAMGWLGWPLDVGGMMTASIALGIAVDDTVHLLTWFRRLGDDGLALRDRIDGALDRVAVPMIRSAVVLGFAFSVFGFCGFKPIAQFGVLMATLLAVALVGDLVQTPAILASPVFAWTIARRDRGRATPTQHS